MTTFAPADIDAPTASAATDARCAEGPRRATVARAVTAIAALLVPAALSLSLWSTIAAAQLGNPLSGLESGASTSTSTTATVSVSTTTTGTTSAAGAVTITVIVIAVILLVAIAFFIVRDARRNAPVRDRTAAGTAEARRAVEDQRRRQKARAKAAREQRKRNR